MRWRKYRRQCEQITGQSIPFTEAMSDAWVAAKRRGRFGFRMPNWYSAKMPIGDWERRRWEP